MSWRREIRERVEDVVEGVIYPAPNPARFCAYLDEPNYYRLGYQMSAQLLHRRPARSAGSQKSDRPPADSSSASESREAAERLLGEAEKMLHWYRLRERQPRRHFWIRRLRSLERRLKIFLRDTVKPCLELVIAAAQVEEKKEPSIDLSALRRRAAAGKLSYRATYNLACFEARETGDTTRALDYLERAFRLAPVERRDELVKWARKDPSLANLRGIPAFKALRKTFAA